MNRADAEDAILARASAEFMVGFAHFVNDCDLFDKSEANGEASLGAQETRPWEHSAVHRQWRRALKQLGKLVAHTRAGAHGKVRVIRCCLDHGLAFDEDVMILVESLILDIDRVLHDDPECNCQLLSAGSSGDFGTN